MEELHTVLESEAAAKKLYEFMHATDPNRKATKAKAVRKRGASKRGTTKKAAAKAAAAAAGGTTTTNA